MSHKKTGKRPTKKKVSLRKMPRIPAPENWTSEAALARYVYVLLPQHYGSHNNGVLFYAFTNGTEINVTSDRLYEFLTDNADRTFITCDALTLHKICMNTFADSREKQAPICPSTC